MDGTVRISAWHVLRAASGSRGGSSALAAAFALALRAFARRRAR